MAPWDTSRCPYKSEFWAPFQQAWCPVQVLFPGKGPSDSEELVLLAVSWSEKLRSVCLLPSYNCSQTVAGWGISPPAASSPSAFRAHYMMPGHRNPFWCCSVTKSCQTLSHVTPWTAACQASLSFAVAQSLLGFMSIESVMPSTPYYPSVAHFSPTPSLSQHQGLFQWLVGSSHQVAKVLEPQLQHQFFQWIFRVDFF